MLSAYNIEKIFFTAGVYFFELAKIPDFDAILIKYNILVSLVKDILKR